jgi:hypothetical protein
MLCLTTGVFGAATTGVTRRMGLYDTNDGVFFEQAGSELAFVVRNAGTDVRIPQSTWNVDKMNGQGLSGHTFNPAQTFIFGIALEWLGVGTVNYGFFINGVFQLCHQQHHAQTTGNTAVYMTTASLPVRGEIVATAALGATASMKMICASVISEGGFSDTQGPQFSAHNGVTAITVSNTARPVLSVRAKATGPNSVANRGQIKIKSIFITTTQPIRYDLIINPALTKTAGSPTFNAVNTTYSLAESCVDADGFSGGIVIDSGYIAASGVQARGSAEVGLFRDFPLVYTDLGNVQDILSIVCIRTGSQDAAVLAAVDWQELQ